MLFSVNSVSWSVSNGQSLCSPLNLSARYFNAIVCAMWNTQFAQNSVNKSVSTNSKRLKTLNINVFDSWNPPTCRTARFCTASDPPSARCRLLVSSCRNASSRWSAGFQSCSIRCPAAPCLFIENGVWWCFCSGSIEWKCRQSALIVQVGESARADRVRMRVQDHGQGSVHIERVSLNRALTLRTKYRDKHVLWKNKNI